MCLSSIENNCAPCAVNSSLAVATPALLVAFIVACSYSYTFNTFGKHA